MVHSDPVVVVEGGLVVRGGRLHGVGPGAPIVVGARDRHLLASKLGEGVGQATIVDDGAAGEVEAPVAAAARAVVQTRIAARDAPDGLETRQEGAAPSLA